MCWMDARVAFPGIVAIRFFFMKLRVRAVPSHRFHTQAFIFTTLVRRQLGKERCGMLFLEPASLA